MMSAQIYAQVPFYSKSVYVGTPFRRTLVGGTTRQRERIQTQLLCETVRLASGFITFSSFCVLAACFPGAKFYGSA